MNYLIMNKDSVVAKFCAEQTTYGIRYYYTDMNVKELPFKLTDIRAFIESRTILVDRYGLREKLTEIGIEDRIDLIALTYGVSLTDTFWIKQEGDRRNWEAVSPFRSKRQFDLSWFFNAKEGENKFMGIPDYSTDGNFPKCWMEVDGTKWLVKCGTSGAYNAGLEPLSEILFTQLAEYIHFYNYVKYHRLDIDYSIVSDRYKIPGIVKETLEVENGERFASMCECFTNEQKGLVTVKELGLRSVNDIIAFAKEHCANWKDACTIYLLDSIGFNEDRHNGNIGFYFDTDTYEILSVAPMYDNNLSLLCYYDDRVDLDEYVEQLMPKAGMSFIELARKMLEYIPEKEKDVKSISESFNFVAPFKVLNDRVDMLSGIVREQATRILGG